MKLSEAFPSNYLKSDDLLDRDVAVIIASAGMEMVGNERKLILSFQDKKKQMICNKTNAGRIAYLYGEETNDWVGHKIVLTSEFVEFQGRTVKGLRVKPPKRNGPQAAGQSNSDRGGYSMSTGNAPARKPDPLDEMLGDDTGDFR